MLDQISGQMFDHMLCQILAIKPSSQCTVFVQCYWDRDISETLVSKTDIYYHVSTVSQPLHWPLDIYRANSPKTHMRDGKYLVGAER